MTLVADVLVDRGDFRLDVRLEVAPGEVVGIVGPNAAGKTTLLRALAGLDRLNQGWVRVDGAVLADVEAGVDIEPASRRVGLVFQNYLLFPHLNVAANVAFGRNSRAGAVEWMDRLDLGPLAGRMPHELSGGQAQRVALARALATGPRLLLLDEPLAALDVESRHEIRRQLAEHVGALDIPVLMVTHDLIDAAILADRLIVLENGKATQVGTLAEITARPRSSWAARLAGANLYQGRAEGHILELADGGVLTLADELHGPAFASIAPQAVSVHLKAPEGSPRNVWQGRIAGMEPVGGRIRVRIDGMPPVVAEITQNAAVSLGLADVDTVWVSVKAAEIEAYLR